RARGFFSIYMTLAGVLILVLVGALPRIALGGRPTAWAAPAWVPAVVSVGRDAGRGARRGVGGGRPPLALAPAPPRAPGRRGGGLGDVVVVVAASGLAERRMLDRVKTVPDLTNDTARHRLAMLSAGLGLAIAHPVTGIGPGQVKNVYPMVAPPEALRRSTSHLHNTPLQIVVERGLPGLAAWIAIWVGFFGAAWRVFRRVPPADEDAR